MTCFLADRAYQAPCWGEVVVVGETENGESVCACSGHTRMWPIPDKALYVEEDP